ncbi:RNA polymerase sigma factor [Burkholderia gladioli]|uniref:RNA polymerase sigma factor n=1 Tax=Burkholderia gladioli TaxID=28095 RepID=UPI0016407CFB|nr:RNA polymerase sigma factor [Burkholderia gladioli]
MSGPAVTMPALPRPPRRPSPSPGARGTADATRAAPTRSEPVAVLQGVDALEAIPACPAARPSAAAATRTAAEPGARDVSERDPDAELVERVGRRDPGAARALVARKLPRLLALATRLLGDRMEAEDVAQEAFIRIWKQAPRWKSGEARFDTWLHRVALNLCYDRLRGHREEPAEELPEQMDPQPLGEQRLEALERDARVRRALDALPARQREALVLHYYQELSNIEAAGLMGITVDALESLLSRARRNLRAQLAGDGRSEEI